MDFGTFKLKDLDNMIEEDEKNLRLSVTKTKMKNKLKK